MTSKPNIQSDAQRVFHVLQAGGIAIIPANVGYGIVATSPTALERTFHTKKRNSHKKHAMIGNYALHREIHTLPPLQEEMVHLLTVDLDLPLGVVAPFRENHPLIQKLGTEMVEKSSVDGTLSMLVNAGKFVDELSRLTAEAGLPLMGSSANLTGQGSKVTVEDIEPEILEAADIVINYGRQKLNYPRPSSTIFDFQNMKLVRFGACYDVIQDALKRFYGVVLPDDPGRERLFSGHVGY